MQTPRPRMIEQFAFPSPRHPLPLPHLLSDNFWPRQHPEPEVLSPNCYFGICVALVMKSGLHPRYILLSAFLLLSASLHVLQAVIFTPIAAVVACLILPCCFNSLKISGNVLKGLVTFSPFFFMPTFDPFFSLSLTQSLFHSHSLVSSLVR